MMHFSQVVGPRRSEVVEVPTPSPGPGKVLVAVEASGVCASDYGAWADHDGTEPLRLGHEVTGSVASLGVGAYGWAVGDRVTGFGGPGYADMVVMEARGLMPVPGGLPAEAVLGEPLACQAETFLRSPVRPGGRVAVVGLGYMGLGFLQMARLRGPSALVGVDLGETGRSAAMSLGATEVYHPADLPESYTGKDDLALPGDLRFDVVVEATGSAAGLGLAGDLTAPDGALVVLGYHAKGTRELDLSLWYKTVTIINGFSANKQRRMDALAWGLGRVAERRLTYGPLITHRFGLDQIDVAFNLFTERPPGFIKAIVQL